MPEIRVQTDEGVISFQSSTPMDEPTAEREPREVTASLGDYAREPIEVSIRSNGFANIISITHEEARRLREALLEFVDDTSLARPEDVGESRQA